MIRIRLNNCAIVWKQQEFLHDLHNMKKLVSVQAIHRFIFSIFAYQNFSRDRKAELLRKWIALVLQVKFRFMGYLLVKVNALISGNIKHHRYHHSSIVFMKQPSAEIFSKHFFRQYFCELLENSCSASKITFWKLLESSQKSSHGKVLFQ